MKLAREVSTYIQPSDRTDAPAPSSHYSRGWPCWLPLPTPENLSKYNTIGRYLDSIGLNWGSIERDHCHAIIQEVLGLDFYWASWRNGSTSSPTNIYSLLLWDIKATKYLNLKEMTVLISHITDLLGYDSVDYVDEDERISHAEPDKTHKWYYDPKSKKTLKGFNSAVHSKRKADNGNTAPLNRDLREPSSPRKEMESQSRTATKSAGLSAAEIRRRRFRALNRS